MHIIELPDGYNGHTVTCDTEPIETDGDMLKLAVVDNSLRYRPYLVRWIHRDDLNNAIKTTKGQRMTLKKAKMYRTARIAEPIFTYKAGDIVGVQFIGRGSFGLNFRINFPDKPTIVVADNYLTDFVL